MFVFFVLISSFLLFSLRQPSSRQCENADRLLNKRDSKTGKLVAAKSVDNELSIPMFSADGLAIKRGNGEVSRKVFLSDSALY